MHRWLMVAALVGTGVLFSAGFVPQARNPQTLAGTVFYVSRNGDNSDGRSWNTAWNELDQIDWPSVQPGDVITIDGGTVQMQYDSEMLIENGGEAGNPIRIQASMEPGHNGKVIIFGGREALLPYCGQAEYDGSKEDSLRLYGIRTNGFDNIEIDGVNWRGIVLHGFGHNGIWVEYDSENITIRNVEVYNNGSAEQTPDGWTTDLPGIRLSGTNVLFERVLVHDNGQDAFQSSNEPNNVHDFTLRESWLYNSRRHPEFPDESFNYCTHSDGIQIYAGGVISGVTLQYSIIGPGFMQNLLLGQSVTELGEWAAVQDVVMEDLLLIKPTSNNIYGYSDTDSWNWRLNRLTLHCPNTDGQCLQILNSFHSITNTIIYGGKIYLPDGLDHYEGNCVWNIASSNIRIGETANPRFVNVSDTDRFSLDNYAMQPDSPCLHAGSQLTSVNQLLGNALP